MALTYLLSISLVNLHKREEIEYFEFHHETVVGFECCNILTLLKWTDNFVVYKCFLSSSMPGYCCNRKLDSDNNGGPPSSKLILQTLCKSSPQVEQSSKCYETNKKKKKKPLEKTKNLKQRKEVETRNYSNRSRADQWSLWVCYRTWADSKLIIKVRWRSSRFRRDFGRRKHL